MTNVHSAEYRRFRERLVRARKKAGLSQSEVARALGKLQSYVAKCESGERRVDVIELLLFARLYKQPLEYFV